MNIGHQARALKDGELLIALSSIVRRSNEITAELIEHLAELDRRQLHLDLGFPSLFAYCVESLGLCEATAGRRIAVARVCRNFPEALTQIATGALHVSALCLRKQHLTPENAAELFNLCSGQSARKVEVLLATRFPKPDVCDSIRPVPTRLSRALDVESAPLAAGAHLAPIAHSPGTMAESEAWCAMEKLASQSSMSRQLSARPVQAVPQRLEPLSADRFAVRFTADAEFCDLLERVRGPAGHRLPSGDLFTLMKRALQTYERELAKERFGVGRKLRVTRRPAGTQSARVGISSGSANPNPARPATRRRPTAAAVREVYARDQKRCSFVSKDGRRCEACKFLELDHVIPWALGGDESPANLRLRCRAHNQRYAQQIFGAAHYEPRCGARECRTASDHEVRAEQSPNLAATRPSTTLLRRRERYWLLCRQRVARD